MSVPGLGFSNDPATGGRARPPRKERGVRTVAFNRNYLSWQTLKQTIWTDVVTVSMFGDEYARERFRYFSSPHPRFPLIPRKSLGAALIDLQGSYADYRRSKFRPLAK